MHRFTHTLLLIALLTWTATAAAGPADTKTSDAERAPTADEARAAFERFKSLAGSWQAESTKGWTGGNEYRVIGRGTSVLGTSTFTDAPEAGMATVFHLDGDRLMLTHYCEAGNQPRMVATKISADGTEVTFSFLDATNLSSPDDGHMGDAFYRFDDDNHFTSRWSFLKNRDVVWAEDITYERAAAETEVAAP